MKNAMKKFLLVFLITGFVFGLGNSHLNAPGVKINSTYNNGYYKELNGTSMACPYVTGVVALVLQAKGPKTPDEMKAHLKLNSENLGLPSYQQGAGLVRADLAVLN